MYFCGGSLGLSCFMCVYFMWYVWLLEGNVLWDDCVVRIYEEWELGEGCCGGCVGRRWFRYWYGFNGGGGGCDEQDGYVLRSKVGRGWRGWKGGGEK
ncbi:hypothetical protein, partial [Bacillus sp. WP8]|uniref:hypothetical protein n=1 Tax=Bacillus sp. WP8 TaxID=756828 RepID=UPI001C92DD50